MRLALADYLLRQAENNLGEAARQVGAEGLELTYGPVAGAERPWFQAEGPSAWKKQTQDHGLLPASLSVTYFWWHRLFETGPEQQREHQQLLLRLLEQAGQAGIPVLHLPCYDLATPLEADAQRRVLDLLHPLLHQAVQTKVTLALETVWSAEDTHRFLAKANCSALKIAYDVGNACAAGRDVVAELTLLGGDVAQLRIKDRSRGEPFTSVRLGEGGVPFPALVKCLQALKYPGWLILTTPSGDDPLGEARRNVSYLQRIFSLLPGTVETPQVRKA
jgi:sugar phosphate isomerase/epimerase